MEVLLLSNLGFNKMKSKTKSLMKCDAKNFCCAILLQQFKLQKRVPFFVIIFSQLRAASISLIIALKARVKTAVLKFIITLLSCKFAFSANFLPYMHAYILRTALARKISVQYQVSCSDL